MKNQILRTDSLGSNLKVPIAIATFKEMKKKCI